MKYSTLINKSSASFPRGFIPHRFRAGVKKVLDKQFLIILIFASFMVSPIAAVTHAQESNSSGTSISISVIDKDAKDGNIVSQTNKGYALSKSPYDPDIYGVITQNPSVYLENTEIPDAQPVVTWGKAYVLVASIYENISKNYFITT